MQRHIRRSTLLLTALLLPWVAPGLAAQLSATVPVGATVRWQEEGRNRQGKVAQVDDQANVLWVRQPGKVDSVPVGLGTPQLALKTRPNRKAVAALAMFGAGFALGMALGDDECDGFCIISYTAPQKGMMFGTTLGLLGLLVGHKAEWQSLANPVSGQPGRVSAVIEPGRLGVRVAF